MATEAAAKLALTGVMQSQIPSVSRVDGILEPTAQRADELGVEMLPEAALASSLSVDVAPLVNRANLIVGTLGTDLDQVDEVQTVLSPSVGQPDSLEVDVEPEIVARLNIREIDDAARVRLSLRPIDDADDETITLTDLPEDESITVTELDDDETITLTDLSGTAGLLIVGRGGTVTQRELNPAGAADYATAFARYKEIVQDKLGNEIRSIAFDIDSQVIMYGEPTDEDVNDSYDNYIDPRDGFVYKKHFISVFQFIEDHGLDAAEISELENTLQTIANVAKVSGKVGEWRREVSDEIRGAGVSNDQALSQRSSFVRVLPRKDLKSFAQEGSLNDLINNSKMKPKEATEHVVKAEAFYRSVAKQLKEKCVILEATAPKVPFHAANTDQRKELIRLHQLKNLLQRLENEHDRYAHYWAAVYAAKSGTDQENAVGLEEGLKQLIPKKGNENLKDADIDSWYQAHPEGEATADYAREAGALLLQDRESYLKWCYDHNQPPVRPNITSFLMHAMQEEGKDLRFSEFGIRIDEDGQEILSDIFAEAADEAEKVKNSFDDKITADTDFAALEADKQAKKMPDKLAKMMKEDDFSLLSAPKPPADEQPGWFATKAQAVKAFFTE